MLSPGANNLDFDLPPGASSGSTFARFRFSLQPDLSFVGQADSGEVKDYQVEIDVPEPSIDIEKYTNGQDADTPTGPVVEAGSPVAWTYEVINTGNVPLSSVTVTDSQGVTVSCEETSLNPGESMTCHANGTAAAGQYGNVGTATAISPQDQDVMDEDPSHYFGELPPTDFGDAPDPTYPTLLESDGARHLIDPDVYLGSGVDAEPDGQPDSSAQGDDNADTDDEDGIPLTSSLAQGSTNTFTVNASTDGLLNAWIDFNIDGDWEEPDEQIFIDHALVGGSNNLNIEIPLDATPGTTLARFRFSRQGGLSFTGEAEDGEVEDYVVEIDEAEMDFGDAPDPTYPTLLESNGARHVLGSGVYLGSGVDADANGQPDSYSYGDDNDGNDDEDGIGGYSNSIPGETVELAATASVDGYLNAWVDFNDDGDWADADEQIFTDELLTAGFNSLEFSIPLSAKIGYVYGRFRFSIQKGLSYDGLAEDGEVEDHRMTIREFDYGDAPPPYPTLRTNNGARHIAESNNYYLGKTVDGELNGQPDSKAMGDDNDGTDDEDGVIFTSALTPGSNATISVESFSVHPDAPLLNAWIDFNIDGDWADAGEQIFTDEAMPNFGTKNLSFNVPAGAVPGTTFARFRLGDEIGLSFDGPTYMGEVEDYQVEIRELMDYGDAPDTYHTLLASNGARHAYDADVHLGLKLDLELDGQPDAGAAGDDNNGDDDEDGVSIASPLRQGQPYQITVTASTEGLLNAWMDFNDDGFWAIPHEQIFTDQPLGSGPNSLTFDVPIDAVVGDTFARFRFSRQAGLLFEDRAEDGEVEDYVVEILEAELDYGDAPDPSFPTLSANNGARHVIVPGIHLGSSVDSELDGQPTQNADGDDNNGSDDEDGVSWEYLWRGHTDTVDITASKAGLLNAWIDFNIDGDWADPGEQIFADQPLNAGGNHLSFYVPEGPALGATPGRFRFSTEGGLSFVGQARDGEVEDSFFNLIAYDFGDAPDPPYPTLLLSNGASHPNNSDVYLGSTVDYEVDGQPDPSAMGDDNGGADDEDGVIFTSAIVPGGTSTVTVISSKTGCPLDAWIDFTIDGDWDDTGEHIFDDVSLNAGPNNLSFNVPEAASPGSTFARFRLVWGDLPLISYDGEDDVGEVEDYQVEILEPLDYGDAPDTYRTLLASNGARHAYDADVYLGLKLDLEPDGQPDAGAAGDDNNGDDDEDGVNFTSPLWRGESCAVTVTASTEGLLNAWIDFNDDGVWTIPDEQIFTDQALAAGPNPLTFQVPRNAVADATFARFRFSRQAGLLFGDWAENGEVEDYVVEIQDLGDLDFGDAPDPTYPTLWENNGARHVIAPGVRLGQKIDADDDGQPHPCAAGDDTDGVSDEEGSGCAYWRRGHTETLTVYPSTGGFINAWTDFNADGDWADPGEYIIQDEPVAAGTQGLPFNVPANAALGITFVRVRFSTYTGLSYEGLAWDGEVEDHDIFVSEVDCGDAPAPYPTKLLDNGASHDVRPPEYSSLVCLGSGVDGEIDGQPESSALGDDNDGNDDEDGVAFISPLVPVDTAVIEVTVSAYSSAYLYGWIDFNRDGDWADPDDYIIHGKCLFTGTHLLSFNVPAGASPGPTFARFRIAENDYSVASYVGFAESGEVEDYQVEIAAPPELDYGDAPDPTGQPNAGATGDDLAGTNDEDGVIFTSSLMPGNKAYVAVTVSKLGYLNAWIDFNIDGDWADSGEQIFDFEMVYPGLNSMDFNVPAGAVLGETYARFRFSTSSFNISYDKLAHDGEVEDYKVEIGASTQQCSDTNGDGVLDVSDATKILSYLYLGGPPPSCPPAPYCCAEVNGDGVVDISDAIAILSHLYLGAPPPVNSCCQGPTSPVIVPTIQIAVGIFNVIGQAGGNVTLPINLGDATSLGIGVAAMHLTYDPDVLTPVGVNTEGTIASGWDVDYDTDGLGTSSIFYDAGTIQEAGEGHIVIALAGSQELSGSGSLVNVVFSISNDAVEGQTSPIQLSDISFSSGDPAEVDGEAEFAVGELSSIPLQSGWNLISLPLQPPNPNPDIVLSSIAGKYNSVWAYDPNTGWSIYIPGGPGNLVEIRAGKGYWIEMDESWDLDIQGTTPEPTAIKLWGEKWNLVGYNSSDPRSAEEAMGSVENYINSVCEYSPITGWSVYSPGMPGDLEVMKPGYGYWIKVDETCDWNVNAP